jgi:hypothetical protein
VTAQLEEQTCTANGLQQSVKLPRLINALILTTSRHALPHGGFFVSLEMPNMFRSRLFELALVLVCLNHIASFIVNADHGSV